MISITGVHDVIYDFIKSLPNSSEMQNILIDNSEPFVKELQSKIPVDKGVTRDALRVIKMRRADVIIVGIDYRYLQKKGGASKRPSNILYFIEEGHKTKRGSVTPRPFVVNTYNSYKEKLAKDISDDIILTIEKKFNAGI